MCQGSSADRAKLSAAFSSASRAVARVAVVSLRITQPCEQQPSRSTGRMGCGPSKVAVKGGADESKSPMAQLIGAATDELTLSPMDVRDLQPLSEVPLQVFSVETLTSLNMKGNRLTEIPDGIARLVNLRVLDISENQLGELPVAMQHCTALEELDASENKLRAVFTEIGALTKLRRLILFKNGLTTLPESLGQCAALTEVNIFNNRIIRIPASFAKLEHLDDLTFGGNKLKTLPDVSKWREVSRLAMQWNTVVMLPSFEPMADTLVTLQLDRNCLNELPKMGAMTKLDKLDCNKNYISRMPEDLGSMINLVNLNFAHNKLTFIPAHIGELHRLEILDVSDNAISEIPHQLGKCLALKTLFVHQNTIKGLPDALTSLPNLTRLNMTNNEIPIVEDPSLRNICNALRSLCVQNGGWIKADDGSS